MRKSISIILATFSQLLLIFVLQVIAPVNTYSQYYKPNVNANNNADDNADDNSKTGRWIGLEGSFGLILPKVDVSILSNQNIETTYTYGGSIIYEQRIVDPLSIYFGIGVKYYEMKYDGYDGGTKYNFFYEITVIDMPVGFRFYPMPLISEDSIFCFFIGAAFDVQMPISTKKTVTGGGSSGYSNQDIDFSLGVIVEGGLGVYLNEKILLRGIIKYTIGLIDIDKASSINLKPSSLDFCLGFSFRT